MALNNSVCVLSVGSCFPDGEFTQDAVRQLLGVSNPVVNRLLDAPHVQKRRLMFDSTKVSSDAFAPIGHEAPSQLRKRFQTGLTQLGSGAAVKALERAGRSPVDVDFLVCVTSTGLALPGLSAILVRDLKMKRNVHRLDVVGMGCNAGMTSLKTLSMLLNSAPVGAVGLLVCCEISSALYVNDDEDVGAGIVNSLFGDGAVAAVLQNTPSPATSSPAGSSSCSFALRLLDFESTTLTEYFDDMLYDISPKHEQLNFRLSKGIPYAVASQIHIPVLELLSRHHLSVESIREWVVHGGGAAVMKGARDNLGLRDGALRHTESVMRDYGNLSSGSFLASYERLLEEHSANPSMLMAGDNVVLIAMGPGMTIEVGLAVVRSSMPADASLAP